MDMKTILDTSALPANLVIGNETDSAISLPIYPDNTNFDLQPGDQIIYQVTTSREYLYYYTTCKGLGLALSEQEKG